MTSQKDLFNLHRPKIHVQTVELGPHRQRVFTLSKIEKEKKYTPIIWVIAALVVGFSVTATVFESALNSYRVAKNALTKTDVIAFATPVEEERLLGSDDVVEPDYTLETSEGSYYFLTNTPAPRTSALSYLVADVSSGQTIFEKNPDLILPIASVSKLMTAVVAKEEMDLHQEISVTRSSIETYGTAGGLAIGEKTMPADLLYPLLIESSNDAAEVLALGMGRKEFLEYMNAKARELKMTNTYFEDPSGLSAYNVSSVRDLLILARFINTRMPELWDITRVREYGILSHKWQNGNNQLRKNSFVGGKNGYTDEALRTSVSLFDMPITIKGEKEKQKKRIAVIVLKSNDREGDISKLSRFVETNIGFEKKVSEEELEAPIE